MESSKGLGITQEILGKAHQSMVNRIMEANLPPEAGQYLDAENGGGACPRCKKNFSRVDVDNKHGKFTYYRPSCRCYPKCPGVRVDATLRYKSVRIECGNEFPMEYIINNAVRCPVCQRLTNFFRDKAATPNKPDMSKYKR